MSLNKEKLSGPIKITTGILSYAGSLAAGATLALHEATRQLNIAWTSALVGHEVAQNINPATIETLGAALLVGLGGGLLVVSGVNELASSKTEQTH